MKDAQHSPNFIRRAAIPDCPRASGAPYAKAVRMSSDVSCGYCARIGLLRLARRREGEDQRNPDARAFDARLAEQTLGLIEFRSRGEVIVVQGAEECGAL